MRKFTFFVAMIAVALIATTPAMAWEHRYENGGDAYFGLDGGSDVAAFGSRDFCHGCRGQWEEGIGSSGGLAIEFGSRAYSEGYAPGPSNTATGLDFTHDQGSEGSRTWKGGSGSTWNVTHVEGYTHSNVDP